MEITDGDGGNARWYKADRFQSDRYEDAGAARAAVVERSLDVDVGQSAGVEVEVEVKVEQEDAKGKCRVGWAGERGGFFCYGGIIWVGLGQVLLWGGKGVVEWFGLCVGHLLLELQEVRIRWTGVVGCQKSRWRQQPEVGSWKAQRWR